MDEHSESLWQRTFSGFRTMQNARARFRKDLRGDPSAARIALASAHYTLIGRYMKGWRRVFAAWHALCAARNVILALSLAKSYGDFSVADLDGMSRILVQVPERLGGNRHEAAKMISYALTDHPATSMAKPHDIANLYNTRGLLYWERGDIDRARYHFAEAVSLERAIGEEDSPDRERQLVRVLSEAGCFLWKYPTNDNMRQEGARMVWRAYDLATRVARDQIGKVRARAERVGFKLD